MLKLVDENVKFRTDELAAFAGTFQSLNDDAALELLQETSSEASASFMLLTVNSQAVRACAKKKVCIEHARM